jgi:hypothetical protein
MIKPETLTELLKLSDVETVADVVALRTIITITLPTPEECMGKAPFGERVTRTFSGLLHGDLPRAKRARAIMLACGDYENGLIVAGVGGVTPESLETEIRRALATAGLPDLAGHAPSP